VGRRGTASLQRELGPPSLKALLLLMMMVITVLIMMVIVVMAW
jgi:hypothetical protein